MLRFAQPPDAVFLAILHDALEDLQETITDLEAEDWPALYPRAARCFSPDLARTALGPWLHGAGTQPRRPDACRPQPLRSGLPTLPLSKSLSADRSATPLCRLSVRKSSSAPFPRAPGPVVHQTAGTPNCRAS